jgi:hypothetical protein
MSDSANKKSSGSHSKEIWIALIGAAATVTVALITGYFGLLSSDRGSSNPATPAPAVVAVPVVAIEGPLMAPLGKQTYFTIVSQNAVRASWSAGGFSNNRSFDIEPLAPSHQIWIEPTDSSRIGETFTLVVTVYSADGQPATAQRQFQVTAAQP